jgi:hypothetical protein
MRLRSRCWGRGFPAVKLSAPMIPTNTMTCKASQPRTAHQSAVSARASPTRASGKRFIVPSSASGSEGCIQTAVPAANWPLPLSSLEPRHPPFRNAAHTPTQFADRLNGRPEACERSWTDGAHAADWSKGRSGRPRVCTLGGPPVRAGRAWLKRIFRRPAKLKPALRPAVEPAIAVPRTPASLITFDRRDDMQPGAQRELRPLAVGTAASGSWFSSAQAVFEAARPRP